MVPVTTTPIRFGPFELDAVRGELRKHGLRVRLTPREMSLLCLLLELPLRIRTREEIQRRLWPANTFVDFEQGMNKTVHSLREALGDSANDPRFIETVNATGYRFIPQYIEAYRVSSIIRSCGKPEYIAVLPLSSSGSSEMVLRCARVISHLVDALSGIKECRVMAQATVRSYNVEDSGPQQAGLALGVDAVISGELLHCGNILLLRAELIDVSDGSQLCGAHAEGVEVPGTPFNYDLMARDILKQLRPVLAPMSASTELSVTPMLVKS